MMPSAIFLCHATHVATTGVGGPANEEQKLEKKLGLPTKQQGQACAHVQVEMIGLKDSQQVFSMKKCQRQVTRTQ